MSAAVLPYDPGRDEVLLIRQFLPGAYFGGGLPRPLQIIAGMIEEGESGEDVARREAVEEAGVRIGRMELAGTPFSRAPAAAPSASRSIAHKRICRRRAGFVGLAAEHEDIRVEVYPARDAIALLDDGRIEAGPGRGGALLVCPPS